VAIGVARCSYCESLLIVESGAGRTAGVVILDFAQVRRDYSDSMNGGLTSFAAEGERIFAGSDGQLLPLNARHRIVVARDTSGAYGLMCRAADQTEFSTRNFRGSAAEDAAYEEVVRFVLGGTDHQKLPAETRMVRSPLFDEPIEVNDRRDLEGTARTLASVALNIEGNEELGDEIGGFYWESGTAMNLPEDLGSSVEGGNIFFVVEYFPSVVPIIEGASALRIDQAALDACRNAGTRQRQRMLKEFVGYA
jgi:hypothetical protein